MRQTDLVERVLAYDPDADEALLNKAYVYAMTAHGKQFRASGDPYFAHPLEVAAILTDLKLDVPTIVTALLHDTIDERRPPMRTSGKFGTEIANLVDGVTKLSQLEVFSERTKQAENFRKLMLAITSDIRVLLVKLADRLHNMRTLGYIEKPDKRRRIAQETVDIYAPLAGRIGMQNMREELEDLAFAELDPEARNSIVTHFARLDMVGGDRVGRISDQIKRRFAEHGMAAWAMAKAALFHLAQAADQKLLPNSFPILAFAHGLAGIATGRWASSIPAGRWYRSVSRISFRRQSPTAIAASTPP
jgi:(p)ppGpp synthase/HD superfamily hydrolase